MAGSKAPVFEYDASKSRFTYAFKDIASALSRPRLLMTLVRTTFYNRYYGTIFGGFWLTLTTAVMVTGIGLLWGQVFGVDLEEYFPYIVMGLIVWGTISTAINDGVAVFILGSAVFNQHPMSRSIFALRAIGLQIINLLYKLPVMFVVLFYFNVNVTVAGALTAVLGVLLLLWTSFWFALAAGPFGMRFRDIGQLTNAFVTVAFFFTPVIWQARRLREYQWVLDFNPLYHYLHAIRGSVLGLEGAERSLLIACGISGVITIAGIIVYGQFARRLNYWS